MAQNGQSWWMITSFPILFASAFNKGSTKKSNMLPRPTPWHAHLLLPHVDNLQSEHTWSFQVLAVGRIQLPYFPWLHLSFYQKKKKKKKDDYWLPCYSKLWINNLGLFSSGWTLFISLAPQGAHSLWRETVLNISHMNISYTTELYTKRDWGSSKKGLIDFFPSLAHFIVSLVFTFGEECCSSLRILVNLC